MSGKHVVAAALLIATITVGCGSLNSKSGGSGGAASSPTEAPQLSKEETQKVADRAVMDLSKFSAETRKPTKDETIAEKLATLCHDVPSDDKQLASRVRVWDGDTMWMRNNVIGYKRVTGAEAVAEVRREHKQCKTRTDNEGAEVTVLPPVNVAPPAGVDEVFVYCERFEDNEDFSCNAFLPHGNFVSEVNAGGETQAEATTLLKKLIPISAKALVAAAA